MKTEEKIAGLQTEIADLGVAAKNCKLSADEARRIRAQIAAIHRDINATTEQRAEVAELFEKRELQLANYSAEVTSLLKKIKLFPILLFLIWEKLRSWLNGASCKGQTL